MFDDRMLRDPHSGLLLDLSLAPSLDDAPDPTAAIEAMAAIEAGAIANIDEQRMVGHYWLRAPGLAPTPQLRQAIEQMHAKVAALELGDHDHVLMIGIGGSALGPQMVEACMAGPGDRARLSFLDNTDPDGFARVLAGVDPARTLAIVISKSGRTPETVNGMEAARRHWAAAGEPWSPHAIAITGEGSELDQRAVSEGWRARLPVWDWVGGRTSVTGPVGLVPMQLCGWDWRGLLEGAAAMDAATRGPASRNPAALLAQAWHVAGRGKGDRNLVVLPYRDRFALLGRYLQQLIMESLGKELDRNGARVLQGLTVYGNKGSTDQHAFVQQVRDGRDDCFVHFVETRSQHATVPQTDGLQASDHLLGFMLGTRTALAQAGRPSLSISVPDASARSLGALIALFERAVGIYAELVDINAYHQPGVEAGKRAARETLGALTLLVGALSADPLTAQELADSAGCDKDTAWRLATHLVGTGRARVEHGQRPSEDRFFSA